MMRAVVQDRYGPPEVLRVAEIEPPVAGSNQVLVRVLAAGHCSHHFFSWSGSGS